MVMVTDLELEPPLEAIIAAAGSWVRIPAEPTLIVGVQVAVEVTCTLGLVVVTTTALAVAQYCNPDGEQDDDDVLAAAAAGNTKSLLVRSRLVTVTISRFAALLLLLLNFDDGGEAEEVIPPGLKVGVMDTEEISCILRFLDLVIGPILVIDTEGLPPPPEGESRLLPEGESKQLLDTEEGLRWPVEFVMIF